MNYILIDTAYIDRVTFDLIVNFERMIGRRIPPADLPQWLDCVALDGGLRPGDNKITVLFVHPKEDAALRYFIPSHFGDELDGKAFNDKIGEFEMKCLPVEEVTTTADMMTQCLKTLVETGDADNVMLVGDMETYGEELKKTAAECSEKVKGDLTVFAMEPMNVRHCESEILGYSIMAALGIGAEEINKK